MSDKNRAVQSLNMAIGLKFRIQKVEGLYYPYIAKTKAPISFAVTAKLICVFVFAYAKSRFSHNEAQMCFSIEYEVESFQDCFNGIIDKGH